MEFLDELLYQQSDHCDEQRDGDDERADQQPHVHIVRIVRRVVGAVVRIRRIRGHGNFGIAVIDEHRIERIVFCRLGIFVIQIRDAFGIGGLRIGSILVADLVFVERRIVSQKQRTVVEGISVIGDVVLIAFLEFFVRRPAVVVLDSIDRFVDEGGILVVHRVGRIRVEYEV